MLERLDQIRWAQLSHAEGEADDIPDLLRALLSEQEDVRTEALGRFYETLWSQDEVFEAASYTVPFLIELISRENFPEKENVLYLLKTLSTDTTYFHLQLNAELPVESSGTPESKPPVSKNFEFFQASCEAVAEGIPAYLQILSDEDDPAVRTMAVYLLGTCIDRADEIEQAFRLRLTAESTPEVKAALIIGSIELISNLPDSIPERTTLLRNHLELMMPLMHSPEEAPVVRFAAAFFLIEAQCDRVHKEAQSMLEQTFETSRQILFDLPWVTRTNLESAIYRALWRDATTRLRQLFQNLDIANYEACSEAVNEIEDACGRDPSVAPLAVPYFLKIIENDSVVIRTLAESALSNLGPASRVAVGRLEHLLRHPKKGVRETAKWTLQKIK